jgi:ABC-2 type transport system permease protein
MTASTGTPRRAATAFPPIPLRRRLYGFGSVYGKTMRDSRLSFIIAAGLLGGMSLLMGAAVPTIFPTPASRLEIDALIGVMPAAMVNLFGKPEGLGTLGGYLTWKYGAIFVMGAALWSIFALSGTLAGEARKGSLDLVATTPLGKRRVAVEKLAAHLTVMTLTMVVLAVSVTASSVLFGDAALGDTITLVSGIGFALWVGLIALFFGGLAFLLAPVLGRGGATGVSSIVMLVLWLAKGLEGMDAAALISPFRWTADHIALIGRYDWAPLALVGVCAAVFMAGGVALFVRRDLGVTLGLRMPGLPTVMLGVHGPVSRAFGDLLPRALAWGIGIFLMGAMVSSLVGPMAQQITGDPSLLETFKALFPSFDLGSAGGWIQLFAQLLYIGFGFAAAAFVSKWASDETDGRLELILATPMTRSRWVVAGGIAALLSVALVTVLFALGIAVGAGKSGLDISEPMLGTVVTGLFGAAVVGIGFAVGGLFRTSLAAEIAAIFVIATYLVDLIIPPLKLPEWVHQLALVSHLGQPMVGEWDWVGMGACVVIAVGGIALGAWGMGRRDVAR